MAVPTSLAIDDRLLAKAVRLGGHRTKRATVNEALEEYIKRRQRHFTRMTPWSGLRLLDIR